jgi:integrase
VGFRMLQPWVNPRFYWFRRRVPKAYRTFGMPAEIKFSLGTKDWGEAVLRCQEENLRLEREWRGNLAGTPPTELTHLQITALAGEFYAETAAAHRDEPGLAIEWERSLKKLNDRKRPLIGPPGPHLYAMFGAEARAFLQQREIHLVGEKLYSFLRAYVDAKGRASQTLMSAAKGDYEPADKPPYYPRFEPPKPEQKFAVLWKQFVEAKQLAASTRKKWEPYFAALIQRIGTDDMSRVTEEHLLDWRDALLASKASRRNVKFGYMAAARAFFRWAKNEKKFPTNPGAEVFVTVSEKKKTKKGGFDDREAHTILAAALGPQNERMTEENAAARRWVPWLCAYTGARVNEITQLRACDVIEEDGIWCVHIRPEAGTVKTAEERTVPLHPHLRKMGFVEWARRKKGDAPLFYSIDRQRKKDRKNPTYTSVGNKLADWVRNRLQIKNPKVAPNHGWRYRFKQVGLDHDMKERVLDAIQGHAPRTEGEKYGKPKPPAMLREILKHPWYKIETPTAPVDRRRRGQRKADQTASV